MRVDIVWGEGKGKTVTSAYDAPLTKAGIANFNLMALTSIIPLDGVIAEPGTFRGEGTGQILPAVVAICRQRTSSGSTR